MSYGKVFNYKDENGIEKSVFLRPVSPVKFKEIFRIAKKIGSNPEQTMDKMDDDTITDLVSLCTETVDRSCPEWTKESREDFITMHFTDLINIVFEINSPKQ